MNRSLACLALWASVAPAQQAFVVGSGGQFSGIAAAIAAATAGDIIVVRAGAYDSFTLDKALRILGDPGATIVGPGFHGFGPSFSIRDIPAGLPTVVRGFAMPTGGGLSSSFASVTNCAGPVHIDNVSMSNTSPFQITASAQVSVHECSVAAIRVDTSVVAFTETTAVGFGGFLTPGAPALDIVSGRVVLTGGSYTGGGAGFVSPPGAGVRLQSGRLVVTGRTMTTTVQAAPVGLAFVLASAVASPLPLPIMDLWTTVVPSQARSYGPITNPVMIRWD